MFRLLPRARATTSVDLGNSSSSSSSSSRLLLPNEILGTIFDYLSPDALTRVALVSHRWRANAERVLYSTIILHDVLPRASPAVSGGSPRPAEQLIELNGFPTTTTTTTTTTRMVIMPAVPIITLRCCETLSAHPHLTEYVRRFHLRWETDAVESPLFLIHIAHRITRTLVPTLVHLDSLELSFDLAPHFLESPNNNVPPHWQTPQSLEPPHIRKHHSTEQQREQQHQHQLHLLLLPPISLPSLRTLSLRGIGDPPSSELERILHNNSKLLHLRLSDYHRALEHLSPTDVPHLRSFRGYPATAASILPGRPVQTLSLVGGCELATEEDLARIAAGSIPVRALDLSGMIVTPTLLQSISRHLSHVEWLKVRLALRHTLHYALSGIRLLTALTTVLAAFYNLRGLDLSPTNAVIQSSTASVAAASDGPQQQNAVEEQHLCITWMSACPSLRRVVFPSQTEWLLSETGTWISGSGSRSRSPRCHLGGS